MEKLKHMDCVDQTIFNEAQKLVETDVKTYPLFFKSDLYIQDVQSGGESPKTSNTSRGSNSVQPVSALLPLPTLREGEELKQEDCLIKSGYPGIVNRKLLGNRRMFHIRTSEFWLINLLSLLDSLTVNHNYSVLKLTKCFSSLWFADCWRI